MSLSHLVQPPKGRALRGSVEFWQQKASDHGGRVAIEFERKRDGLAFQPARLVVYIEDADGTRVERHPEPWDEEVNDDLVAIGGKAVSAENESERLGYALKFKLEPAEVRYGDGYFNAMIVWTLRELGFGEVPLVARCLERIAENEPSKESDSFHSARRDIEATLREAGGQLTGTLGYDADTAQQILAGAVAYYLDDRFHITNRELLGFL